MSQKLLERDRTIGDEACALLLPDRAEGPRRHDRELLSDHVLADVEGGRIALAHEADAAPRAGALDGRHARLWIAGAVDGRLDALAVGQLAQRRHRIHRAR